MPGSPDHSGGASNGGGVTVSGVGFVRFFCRPAVDARDPFLLDALRAMVIVNQTKRRCLEAFALDPSLLC